MDSAKRERIDARLREMLRHFKKHSGNRQPSGVRIKRGSVIRRRQGQPDKQIPAAGATMT